MHPARQEALTEMILGMIINTSVQQKDMAKTFSSTAKTSSSMRRVQRFIQKQKLDYLQVAKLIFSTINDFAKQGKYLITIDRTNWKYGKTSINLLVVGLVWENITVPLFFHNLDREGNSNCEQRISIITDLLQVIQSSNITAILADREFIGQNWIEFLNEQSINYCIRIKANMLIQHKLGGYLSASAIFKELKVGQEQTITTKLPDHLPVKATAKRTEEELIILISPVHFNLKQLEVYRQRWTIETLFKALKSAGFNLFLANHL